MTSITKTIETMRAYVQQARQDKSFKGISYPRRRAIARRPSDLSSRAALSARPRSASR
jgi:hypothetical protein